MLLVGGVLLVSAYALLPLLLDDLVAQALQGQLGLTEKPGVELEGGPLGVLTGRFKGGRVTLANPELGGVRPHEVTVDLDHFDLDVLGSLASGRLKSEKPLSGSLEAELSEEEVARIAASSGAAAAPVKGVEFEEGWMVVDSEVEVLGTRIPVGVEGSLLLRNSALVFDPDRIEALGMPVPKRLTQGLLRGADFSYPMDEESPFELTFSGMELHKGRLVLHGDIGSLPLG